MKATALAWLDVTAEDRALFADPVIDTWEGGFAGLIRQQRDAWHREGSGALMPVDDFPTYQRIKHYATSYGSGGWQGHVARWAAQLPDDLQDPQQGLF